LTGVISPTLLVSPDPGGGQSVPLSGSWLDESFSLTSQPFVSELIEGIPITRTLYFQEGVITSAEITRTLLGLCGG